MNLCMNIVFTTRISGLKYEYECKCKFVYEYMASFDTLCLLTLSVLGWLLKEWQ